jgi:hypothetical protein
VAMRRLVLVNQKQKIAVLASGLVVATGGFVVADQPAGVAGLAKSSPAAERASSQPK